MQELRRHPRVWLVLCLLVVTCYVVILYIARAQGELLVAFLDVGQGDAVFIQAPNGNQLLYDAGPPSGAVLRRLGTLMPFWDRTIDIAVMSHPDLDHIGGFPDILSRYRVALALEPGVDATNGVYDVVTNDVVRKKVDHFSAHTGMRIVLDRGVYADVLYPDGVREGMDTNDASLVLRLVYGDTAFLLSGDLSSRYENALVLRYGTGLRANVLKLGHHGSRTSTSPLWLTAVHPDVAVISAGKDNRYGHPHKEVVALLDSLHTPTLSTMASGTLVFLSDGTQITTRTR